MPRALTLLISILCGQAALGQPSGLSPVPEPVWILSAPAVLVSAGAEAVVRAQVQIPENYYQDAGSEFLVFEPVSLGAFSMVRTEYSPSVHRAGKPSFSGVFTISVTLRLAAGQPSQTVPVLWKAGWQICQIDGVCLLPEIRTLTLGSGGEPTATPVSEEAGRFWTALAGALLGGLILNLMPCVFPVLALKGISLVSSTGLTRRRRQFEALAFGGGTVGSLAVIGMITAGAAALGQRWDWGFTFQEPAFVWFLTLVFWAFCLQLWGVWAGPTSPFSLTAPGSGLGRSAAAGGLFVLAAAPCTAPFLGPALGYAFSQPPAVIPVFFTAAGLGLALPALVLAAFPGWGRWLPKTGPWMVTAERTAGFVLAATVVYLLWIFTRQTGDEKIWPALVVLGLAAAGFAAWNRRTRLTRTAALVLALAAAAVSWLLIPADSAPPRVTDDVAESGWTPFTPGVFEAALATGRPVFVDATAAWCATCQINELAVLNRPDVIVLFDSLGVIRLRADYTRPSDAIRNWLTSVERAGLPVYALYRQGQPVHLFPELLTDANFTFVLPALTADPGGP